MRSKCSWTVHAPPACPYGRMLRSMLERRALACLCEDMGRQATIVKRWRRGASVGDAKSVAVRVAE